VTFAPGQPRDREFDLVVYGATGFVGRLLAAYLAEHAAAGVRLGLAGRSAERLAAVREGLGAAAADWTLIVADSGDPAALAALTGRTRVVATTVGPYAKYGIKLVEACARAGTHYADLSGEVLFVRDSIDRAHELARSTGARIVHATGFDSVPSDLGVLLAHERARADDAGDLTDTTLVVVSLKGGISGGTIDSLRGQVDAARTDAANRRLLADPYALSPDRPAEPDLGKQPDAFVPRFDKRVSGWIAPFVMGPFNTRIVRRSNALQDWSYGRRFCYREVQGFGNTVLSPALAMGAAAMLGSAAVGFSFPPTRAVLDRALPSPGEGPSEKTRRNGHFHVQVHAATTSGRSYISTVKATGDPGCAATAVMIGESALALAFDGARLPDRAGVLTPASAVGNVLAERLRAAGFTLSVD